ncbi:MAG: type II toxin-antitoxin system YhaV family toxin [Terrimicrobiaceae bacterium]
MASRRRHPAPASGQEAPLPIVQVNGWSIFAHPVFIEQFETLIREVEKLRAADPTGYREKKKTKLLGAVQKMAFEVIPQNPAHPMFLQGNTLGAAYRHWHRGKFFEGRYRLFFRFSSAAKVIVLAWVNDEATLRTYGSRTDAYAVFKSMLGKSRPPDEWKTLLKEAKGAAAESKKLLDQGGKSK